MKESKKSVAPEKTVNPLTQEAIKDLEKKILKSMPFEEIGPRFQRSLEKELLLREQEIKAKEDLNQWSWYFIGFLLVFLLSLLISTLYK